MDYAAVQDAFFLPRDGAVRALSYATPARRLRDALEPVAAICFWSEPSYDAYAARGMDFLSGYVWSRASVLGEPHPEVAAAAFGVFEPGLVTGLYAAGLAACPAGEMRSVVAAGVAAAMHAALGEPGPEVAATTDALRAAAAAVPTVGRALAAGWSAQPPAAEPWIALWQAASTLRELRGDAHLAALVAAGIDGVAANVLTERWVGFEPLSYTGSRAWSPEAMAAATDGLHDRGLLDGDGLSAAGTALREDVERATDLDAVLAALEPWGERITGHGWFPPDPYKRAAG